MRELLRAGLRRLTAPVAETPRHPDGGRKATVIAIATRKGGVGKTTTSVALAAALARFHGRRVLLVDLDPQGHVTTALKTIVAPTGTPLSQVLLGDRGSEVLDAISPTSIPNLWVTPYDPNLAAAEDILGSRIGKEMVLRDALRITRTHFDVIVLDCPPNLGNLSLNGLVAADRVLVPCDPSPLALNGVHALVDAIETIAARLNPDLDVMGVLLTRVDGRNTTVNDAIVKEIEKTYGHALMPVRIGVNSDLAKAQMEGRDIFAFAPDSRGAAQYRDLADHVAAVLPALPQSPANDFMAEKSQGQN